MKDKYIILLNKKQSTRDIFVGPRFTGATTRNENLESGITIEVEEIDIKQIPSITSRNEVIAIAPAMPVKLIKPVNIGMAANPVINGAAWGINAVGANTSSFTGEGITVAILDTGIDSTHAAFNGIKLIQKDFTGEGNDDKIGHGTHCAGTIFGRDVTNTRIGIARGIKTALIGKALGDNGGSSDNIINAMHWAVENGAHIISMSLGIDFPGFVAEMVQQGIPVELATSRALEGYRANVLLFEKVASAIRTGGQDHFTQTIVITAAAGNESRRNENFDFEISVSPPAVSDGIISVAAIELTMDGFKAADFSNTGANIAAPGVNVLSANKGGGLITMSGTSMATPHLAGVAALWAEKLMKSGLLNPLQLTARIIGSGINDGFINGVDQFDIGGGLVRAPQN